jgi:hypothetical protein
MNAGEMACECDGIAQQCSKLLDKVQFLGKLLTDRCGKQIVKASEFQSQFLWFRLTVAPFPFDVVSQIGKATKLRTSCLWVRVPLTSSTNHDVVERVDTRR